MPTERSGFDDHDAFEPAEDSEGYALTTVAFPVRAIPDGKTTTVTVRVPTLAAATADEIGEVVGEDWERTLGRRLEDAPGALPARPDLEAFSVTRGGDHLEITYRLSPGGPEIAKAVAEYVEGTYVETTIPGYEYEPPVADLLASARTTGRDEADAGSGDEDGTVQQFRGGAPRVEGRGLATLFRKHDANRMGRKPTQSDANHETVAVRLANNYLPTNTRLKYGGQTHRASQTRRSRRVLRRPPRNRRPVPLLCERSQ